MITDFKTITASDWSCKLGSLGEVVAYIEDIGQCINIILATPKGSDPLRPEFGSDIWRYIDYPIDRAIPHIVRESIDAILTWEPRVEVVSVSSRLGDIGQLIISVVWNLKGGIEQFSTEVAV